MFWHYLDQDPSTWWMYWTNKEHKPVIRALLESWFESFWTKVECVEGLRSRQIFHSFNRPVSAHQVRRAYRAWENKREKAKTNERWRLAQAHAPEERARKQKAQHERVLTEQDRLIEQYPDVMPRRHRRLQDRKRREARREAGPRDAKKGQDLSIGREALRDAFADLD